MAQAVKRDVADLLKDVGDKTVFEEVKRTLEMVLVLPSLKFNW